MELAEIGAYRDETTGLMGVNRLALTDEDAQGRALLIRWMADAGLTITIDRMGNVFGRREGTDPGLAPVLTGSHIDSVATAGAFDGCLGVLGALEAIHSLNEAGIATRRAIEIVSWTEEEGVRFGAGMLASAVAAGRIPLTDAYARQDARGRSVGDELERIGFKGDRPVPMSPPHAYVECHIEQGPILAKEGFDIGVVTGVQAIAWLRLTFHGKAAHAGTTPLELRADAGLAAAHAVVKLRTMAESGVYGPLRATAGHIATSPGLPNVVPERADVVVDLRTPDDAHLTALEQDLEDYLGTLGQRYPGIRVEIERMARTRPVPFDDDLQRVVEDAAADLGLSSRRLISGAGHDAQEVAALAPTAMVFVPGEYDGISHNPREYSSPEACAAGIDVLATALLRLAL